MRTTCRIKGSNLPGVDSPFFSKTLHFSRSFGGFLEGALERPEKNGNGSYPWNPPPKPQPPVFGIPGLATPGSGAARRAKPRPPAAPRLREGKEIDQAKWCWFVQGNDITKRTHASPKEIELLFTLFVCSFNLAKCPMWRIKCAIPFVPSQSRTPRVGSASMRPKKQCDVKHVICGWQLIFALLFSRPKNNKLALFSAKCERISFQLHQAIRAGFHHQNRSSKASTMSTQGQQSMCFGWVNASSCCVFYILGGAALVHEIQ